MTRFDPFSPRLARLAAIVCLAQFALLYFSVVISAADDPKPAAPPATAPVQPPPSPKAIALAFVAALDKGDAAAAKVCVPGDEIRVRWVNATVALSSALKKLDAAAATRFNEAGKSISQNQLHLTDSFKSLDAAQEKIEGDTATLTIPGQAKPLQLTRMAGKWKLQVGPEGAGSEKQLALYARLTKAVVQTTDEITGGAYPNAEAAAKAFAARVLEARLAETK